MPDKIAALLGPVQETLLLPLWGRAVESRKKNGKLFDKTALEVIERIDYDFSAIAGNITFYSLYGWIARSLHIDQTIKKFAGGRKNPVIVNIGCGLDTTFNRVDDGKMTWYNLDLPDVINLRSKFISENERSASIGCSFLDYRWMEKLNDMEKPLFIAAGLLYYFDEEEVRDFFLKIAEKFPGSEMILDISSPFGVILANKFVLESTGMNKSAVMKWGVKNAKILEGWDKRIKILEQYPIFIGMNRSSDRPKNNAFHRGLFF